jgi:hypothetical protein
MRISIHCMGVDSPTGLDESESRMASLSSMALKFVGVFSVGDERNATPKPRTRVGPYHLSYLLLHGRYGLTESDLGQPHYARGAFGAAKRAGGGGGRDRCVEGRLGGVGPAGPVSFSGAPVATTRPAPASAGVQSAGCAAGP